MKRVSALLLALIMLLTLAACGQKEAPETTATPTTQAPTTEPTTVPTTEPETEPPTTVPETEPPVLYRNPLTGESVEELYTARPYAVMINNIKQAMPQCGVENADIIYEILAESGITRCLAVFGDISDVEHIGSVRSARTYFVDLALGMDAIYVHHGGSNYGYDLISSTGLDDLDAMKSSGSAAFYRDQGRLNSGYSLEHTSFTEGEDLVKCAQKMNYALEREEGVDYGWTFVDDATPENGESAAKITIKFLDGGKVSTLNYDAEAGTYGMVQHGSDYIDGNTGNAMAFKNIIILQAKTWLGSDNYHRFAQLTDTEGSGYYACNGQLIPIKWSRGGYNDPFSFMLEDGTPLELNVGKSYIAIVPTSGSTVSYE